MGFYIFIIVLIVIWTLSGIASWINKQKDAERRRMLRAQMGQSAGSQPPMRQTPRGPRRAPARTISSGIADRFPDVLRPPALQPPPRHQPPPFSQPLPRQQPMRQQAPPRQAQMRPQPQRQQPAMRLPAQPRRAARQAGARQVQQAPPPPPIVMEEAAPHAPLASLPLESPTKAVAASPRITSGTLSRWLTPQTLNQQFLLTEILQPPIGMREPKY